MKIKLDIWTEFYNPQLNLKSQLNFKCKLNFMYISSNLKYQ